MERRKRVDAQMPNDLTISLRMPLYFPDGNGSLRLDIPVRRYEVLASYTFALSVYKKGVLLEEYRSPSFLNVLREIERWYRDFGTKPEKVTNDKD